MNNKEIDQVHIVIVEDVEISAKAITTQLTSWIPNCTVSILNNERSFIAELPSFYHEPPDIFIIDLMLRIGDDVADARVADCFYGGLRCAQRLLDNQKTADSLIILISGIQRVDDITEKLKALPPNVLFFPKPLDYMTLYLSMESFLSAKGNINFQYKKEENSERGNMETKFIRVLATLGIPGVALGVFYLLLKAFKFQFSQVDPTWTAAIVVLFLIVVAAITLFALHRWSPIRTQETAIKKTEIAELKEQNQLKSEPISTSGKAASMSVLTVKQIIDQINNSAPFQRDAMAANYQGIKVSWTGNLWDVEKVSSGITGENVKVKINPEPHDLHYSILFEVPLRKYPQLKIARRGDLIGVSGHVIACSGTGMYVKLDAADMTFHEKA